MSEDVRAQTLESWESSAASWGEAADRFARLAEPVTRALLDLAHLAPGHRVLELGAGPGDTGRAAAERVEPDGAVLITDAARAMVDIARERAGESPGVAFRVVDAEYIDAPAASFDAVISRWGLMFTGDPEAPFREALRVLKPGGRLALAAWAPPAENPWFTGAGEELLEQGLSAPPPPGDRPSPFRFAAPGRLHGLLDGAGFADVHVEPLAFTGAFSSWADMWGLQSLLSVQLRDGLALTHAEGARALEDGVRRRSEPYLRPDGGYDIPLVALLGSATA